ncbi:MAG TPA: thermonuclease family protein [Azospirillaceae bacterium]|nr:thermonuclease family protein [Azospirillaceae bacterium]
MSTVVRLPTAAALTAALLAAGAAMASGAREPVLPGPVSAQVLEVVDGDTLRVRATVWLGQEVETRVRMEGVDTPELHGRCPREAEMAQEARRFLQRLVADGAVVLRDVQHDKYGGRVRARVATAGGDDVAEALVRAGLARAYLGEARQPWCALVQAR